MIVDRQGLLLCSRYAFAPNWFHYCGPDRQEDLLGYIQHKTTDTGLTEILDQFETLYPYLVLIASANNIHDPFDKRVVEAYWLGNRLLEKVKKQAFARHVIDVLHLNKKVKKKDYVPMMDRIVRGVPQHTYHVLNLFIRTGHHALPHTLATMDACRISWGRVQGITKEHQYLIKTQPFVYEKKQLLLGTPTIKSVLSIGIKPNVGDWVSIHWGYICDILSPTQRAHLAYNTRIALESIKPLYEDLYNR